MFEKFKAKTAGFKTFIISFLLCLPDILDAVGVIDITPLVPEGWGTKAATLLTISRISIGVTVRSMRRQIRKDDDKTEEKN